MRVLEFALPGLFIFVFACIYSCESTKLESEIQEGVNQQYKIPSNINDSSSWGSIEKSEKDIHLYSNFNHIIDLKNDEFHGCNPLSCDQSPETCGLIDDGCGGLIFCDHGCDCVEDNDCPKRPCEVLVGCNENSCEYVPVVCGEHECVCRVEGGCDDQTPRSCGNRLCTDLFCNPENNACVNSIKAPCGVCDLGVRTCEDGAVNFGCNEAELADVLDPNIVSCPIDWATPSDEIVFVDSEAVMELSNGSRDHPFVSVNAALEESEAWIIIVGGSPIYLEPLVLESGRSIFGGFNRGPYFERNLDQYPQWYVGTEHFEGRHLLGMIASGINELTIVSHIMIQTEDFDYTLAGRGVSNYGAFIENSSNIKLIDLVVHAGKGMDGEGGDSGEEGESGLNGLEYTGIQGIIGGQFGEQRGPNGAFVECHNSMISRGGYGAGIATNPNAVPSGTYVNIGLQGDSIYGGVNSGAGSSSIRGGEAYSHGGVGVSGASLAGMDAFSVENLILPDGIDGIRSYSINANNYWYQSDDSYGGDGEDIALPGGGGGGGGPGYMRLTDNGINYWFLMTGASGGSGGCGGYPGEGGSPGGGSFGLYVFNSNEITLNRCSLVASNGGHGGLGGRGGSGGLGGSGGPGFDVPEPGGTVVRGRDAGAGGDGSQGQTGANGGDGAGGPSYGAFCHESQLVIDEETTFEHGASGVRGRAPEDGLPWAAPLRGCLPE